MPVTRGQSVRPHLQYSPVAVANPADADDDIIVLSSGDEQSLKATVPMSRRAARPKPKNRAPAPPSADVVEISSDDEAVPVRSNPARRQQHDGSARLQQQLREALEELDRLRKEARTAEKQHVNSRFSDATLLANLEESVTCEICTLKMWTPYALPCGHTFCLSCLQDWFGTTQAQHLANYPALPDLEPYRRALRGPHLHPETRRQYEAQLARAEAMHPRPKYTCPTCRAECKTRPTEVFALKAIAERVGKAQGESAPQTSALTRTRAGLGRLIDGPFDGFFP